jgi:Flp pilus assembly protein TadG
MVSMNLRRRLTCERGSQLVEFALVAPLLLLVVFGIVDFGFMFREYEALTNAAREGARVAALPGYGNSDIRARATQYLTASGMTTAGATFTTYCSSTTSACDVTATSVPVNGAGSSCIMLVGVTVTYPHTFLAGAIIGIPSINLTATARMRYEGGASATCS